MSQFLSNLARRAAGLAVTPVQAPPPIPFAFESAAEVDAEEAVPEEHRTPSISEAAVAPVTPLAAQPPAPPDAYIGASVAAEGPPEIVAPRQVNQQPPAVQRREGPSPALSLPTPPAASPEVHGTSLANSAPVPAPAAASSLRRELHIVGPPAAPSGRDPVEPAVVSAPAIETSVQPRDLPPAAHPIGAARSDASQPSGQLPIHVRIGRIEVRDTPPTTPPAARTAPPLPRGFARYSRLRTYRSYQ